MKRSFFASGWRYSLLLPLFWLAGCGANLESYQNKSPAWDLPAFFNGPLRAYGLVTDRQGTVTSRFSVEMQATWQGGEGKLFEQFYFDDGRTPTRTWYLKQAADGSWRGTASDVVGEALAQTHGFALNWRYTLDLELPAGNIVRVNFDDWMYLLDKQRLINRAEIRKFG
ncbi:MAG: DUF3833 domain-containing protein, partial [Aeromonas sp.]